MTGYRHRYAESLNTWADEHAETQPAAAPALDQCGRPGHREHPMHDDCDDCTAENAAYTQHARRRQWEDRNDAADDLYTIRHQHD